MDQVTTRLVKCFQTVFPDMSAASAEAASQQFVAAWDSVAAITLMNVIEEEFGVQMDFEQLAELDSFSAIRDYLQKEVSVS